MNKNIYFITALLLCSQVAFAGKGKSRQISHEPEPQGHTKKSTDSEPRSKFGSEPRPEPSDNEQSITTALNHDVLVYLQEAFDLKTRMNFARTCRHLSEVAGISSRPLAPALNQKYGQMIRQYEQIMNELQGYQKPNQANEYTLEKIQDLNLLLYQLRRMDPELYFSFKQMHRIEIINLLTELFEYSIAPKYRLHGTPLQFDYFEALAKNPLTSAEVLDQIVNKLIEDKNPEAVIHGELQSERVPLQILPYVAMHSKVSRKTLQTILAEVKVIEKESTKKNTNHYIKNRIPKEKISNAILASVLLNPNCDEKFIHEYRILEKFKKTNDKKGALTGGSHHPDAVRAKIDDFIKDARTSRK